MSRRIHNNREPNIRRGCCDICDESNHDACVCLPCCSYPNGKLPLILAQVILLIGITFATFTALDCRITRISAAPVDHFFATNIPEEFYPHFQLRNDTNETRGIGFYFFEDPGGECTFLVYDGDEDQGAYFDFLGSDWEVGRSLAYWTGILAFILWIWLLICSCVANVRMIRYSAAVIAAVAFVLMEGLSMIVLRTTDLCKEENCQAGQTLYIVISAMICFLATGIAIASTKDYPGISERFKEQEEGMNHPTGMIEMAEIPTTAGEDPLHGGSCPNNEDAEPIPYNGLGDAREIPLETMFVDATLGGGDDVQKSVPSATGDGTK